MRSISAITMALAFSFVAVPAMAGSCSSTSCTANVKEFYLDTSGPLYIILDITAADISNLNCTLLAGTIFELPTTDPNYKDIYATLNAAAFAGRQVTLRINDGTNPCTIQYVRVDF